MESKFFLWGWEGRGGGLSKTTIAQEWSYNILINIRHGRIVARLNVHTVNPVYTIFLITLITIEYY